MASPQSLVVVQRAVTADSAQPAAAASRVDGAAAAAGGTVIGAAADLKRKRRGTHVVGQGQPAVVGPVGPAADAPSTPSVHPVAKTPPIPKQRPKKPATKPQVVKRAPVKKASLAAINAVAAAAPVAGSGHTREVFNEMPERCVSIFFSVKLDRLR
jgi:hypothetical protein